MAAGALAWTVMGIENPVHLLFIAAIALVFLGPKRLPELAKALGNGIREFREAINMETRGPAAPAQQPAAPTVQPQSPAEPVVVSEAAPASAPVVAAEVIPPAVVAEAPAAQPAGEQPPAQT